MGRVGKSLVDMVVQGWLEKGVARVGSKERYPVSVQVLLVRQMQEEAGQVPCYATAAAEHCVKKDCCWRSDCYCDEAECLPHGDDEVSVRAAFANFYQARG